VVSLQLRRFGVIGKHRPSPGDRRPERTGGQGNNAYIFPGLGLGVVASGASHVTDEMFAGAARALASVVAEEDLRASRIFPSLKKIRETSLVIARAVAEVTFQKGLATVPEPEDMLAFIKEEVFVPVYPRLA